MKATQHSESPTDSGTTAINALSIYKHDESCEREFFGDTLGLANSRPLSYCGPVAFVLF